METDPQSAEQLSVVKVNTCKFAVVSGFLGVGKTSLMIALTKYYTARYGKAAMISNDLGGTGLADNRLALLCGCDASEITGECICFCHSVLADRLRSYYADGCELILSDIPGFGVGALEHVYHGMEEDYPGQFAFAPFTVLIEPRSAELLCSGKSGELVHILHAQLLEADLIVLNKCDLLDSSEVAALVSRLAGKYPQASVLSASALTGEGLDALALALRKGSASMRHPAICYNDDALQAEICSLSEHYLQYRAEVCCNDFDGNNYLLSLAEGIRAGIADCGFEIPHMKLLAWSPEGDYAKADLLGISRSVELPHRFTRPCTDLAVTLNASAACPPGKLNDLITAAVEQVSARFQLDVMIFRKECFGLGGE